jgi:hypothetical protein
MEVMKKEVAVIELHFRDFVSMAMKNVTTMMTETMLPEEYVLALGRELRNDFA